MLSYWDPIVLLYGNLITGRYIYWCRALEVNCHKICFTTVLIYLKTRSLERPYWCLNSRESDGIKNILSTIGNTLPPGQRGGLCPAYDTVCNQPTDLRGIRPKLPQVSTNWRCNHLVQRVINQRTKRIVGTTCSSSGEIFQGLQRLPLPATTKKLHGWGRYTACYWASHSQFNPTNPRVGQPRPPSEVWDTQWWSSSTPPWPSARATSTRLFSEPPPGPTQPPARLSEPLPEVFLHSQ